LTEGGKQPIDGRRIKQRVTWSLDWKKRKQMLKEKDKKHQEAKKELKKQEEVKKVIVVQK